MKRSKREEVISGLQIMHTWAEYQVENAKLIFDDKACEKVIKWTDEALDLLKEPETQWISVKDSLPEDEVVVLVYVQHKIGWYRAFAWHDTSGWHSSAKEWEDAESGNVSHWMPLSKPLKRWGYETDEF